MMSNFTNKIDAYRMSMRKINVYLRFLIILLVMAVAATAAWAVAAYLVPPAVMQSTVCFPDDGVLHDDAAENGTQNETSLTTHYKAELNAIIEDIYQDAVIEVLLSDKAFRCVSGMFELDEDSQDLWYNNPEEMAANYFFHYPDAQKVAGLPKHLQQLEEERMELEAQLAATEEFAHSLTDETALQTLTYETVWAFSDQYSTSIPRLNGEATSVVSAEDVENLKTGVSNAMETLRSRIEDYSNLQAELSIVNELFAHCVFLDGENAILVQVTYGNEQMAAELASAVAKRVNQKLVAGTALHGVMMTKAQTERVDKAYYAMLDASTEEEFAEKSEAYAALLDEMRAFKAVRVASPSKRTLMPVVVAAVIAGLLAYCLVSGQSMFDVGNTIFFALFTVLCVFPFYYLFINTISNNDAVTSGMVNFYPIGVHFKNYIALKDVADLGSSVIVTVARTIIGTALMVLVSAWAGYLVTKQKMWKRSLMYRALVITMYFNAGLIPWYMNMLMLGLTNNFMAYIIPGMIAPYNIILVKTYIESIPASLEESAVIDGANTPTVFLKIILPLSVPILATIAIFGAVGNWNSFQDSLLLMSGKPEMYTLQHRLYVYLNQSSNLSALVSGSGQLSQAQADTMLSSRVIKYTISMVSIIPILCVYPFMQRFFVKGIMLGAVKG